VIGIHPESVYEFVGTGPTLVRAADQEAGPKTLNQRLRAGYNGPTQATGADDWFADPESFGPGLGPNSKGRWPRRSPAFMKACTSAQRLDEQAIARVQSRMDCAECHQPGGRGQLNFPMATQLTKATQLKDGAWPNLVYAYVSKGLMPPNQPALDPAEREALFECLMQEYYDPRRKSGVLVDWLNNRPAPDSPKARTSVELLARTTLSAQPRYQANAAGAKEFERECAACHATVAGENSDGPSLFAVVGRRAGAASGFGYSPALAEAGEKGLAWTEQNLDGFLIDQEAYLSARLGRSAAPAMSNVYHDDGFRKLIIEYLMTLR
jgi:cytochrome c